MNPVLKNWLAFLFGLGSLTQIRIIGAMGVTEAVCIFLSPFVFISVWPKFKQTKGNKILLFLFLWFLSAVVTDFYRESSLSNALRGVFVLPFVFSAFIVSFALIWDELTRVRWMVLGIALSGIISSFVLRSETLIANAANLGLDVEEVINFKNYYASVIYGVMAVPVVFLYRKIPIVTVCIMLIACAVFLVGGSRGVFLTIFFSAGGAWIANKKLLFLRVIQRSVIMLIVFLGISGLIAIEVYAYSAKQGWLGEVSYNKYKYQSESEIGLLSSRAEFIAAILAIKDSPILGHGSWSVDTNYYGVRMLEYLGKYNEARLRSHRLRERSLLLPAHSHLWQAWIWHGLFGGLFWIYILALIFVFWRHAIHLCRPLIAYNLLLSTTGAWELMFSPFAGRSRWGMLFAIMVLGLAEARRRNLEKQVDSTLDIDAPWNGKWTE